MGTESSARSCQVVCTVWDYRDLLRSTVDLCIPTGRPPSKRPDRAVTTGMHKVFGDVAVLNMVLLSTEYCPFRICSMDVKCIFPRCNYDHRSPTNVLEPVNTQVITMPSRYAHQDSLRTAHPPKPSLPGPVDPACKTACESRHSAGRHPLYGPPRPSSTDFCLYGSDMILHYTT